MWRSPADCGGRPLRVEALARDLRGAAFWHEDKKNAGPDVPSRPAWKERPMGLEAWTVETV
jgi:hypothetical protein